MYLRIYWSKVRPRSLPDVLHKYEELAATTVPGRIARWVTQDCNDPDSLITVTIWKDRENVRAWEASEQFQTFVSAMKSHLVGSQTVSLCQIKLQQVDEILLGIKSAYDANQEE